MGINQSSLENLHSNKYLGRFVGTQQILREDMFWNEFTQFSSLSLFTRDAIKLFKKDIEALCKKLSTNTKASGNFMTLVCISNYCARELISHSSNINNSEIVNKFRNALFIIRCCCEYFAEHLFEDDFIDLFNTVPLFDDQVSMFEEYILVLSEVISFVPVNSSTYYVHFESITSYIVLLSTQLFQPKPKESSKIFLSILHSKCSGNAITVIQSCLHNYIKNDPPPSDSKSVVSWAASGIWSMFVNDNQSTDSPSNLILYPLANHSFFLLNLFVFSSSKEHNLYRKAVLNCKPGKSSGSGEDDATTNNDCSFTLNFNRLFSALARDLHMEQTVLLLYTMLHKNKSFVNYLLRQKDLENILLPLLKVLYDLEKSNPHSIYMVLICILIFTQDSTFNNIIHHKTGLDLSWYKEKKLIGISLGSFIVLILLRTIQFNMAKMRDKYLHTNCLASLANMASNFTNLHPVVTQKLTVLLEQLIKRLSKLVTQTSKEVQETKEVTDVEVLEEIIYMLLEIINASLFANIEESSNLILSLLRNKELFDGLATKPKFKNIVTNIAVIFSYFGKNVNELAEYGDSPDSILTAIKQSSAAFPIQKMVKFPALMFRYLEEESAEEFFIPYLWSIIYKQSFLYWNSDRILLFPTCP
uniref:Dymeclin n=1 Tax=Hydra vulgaris TaxID=6087 RepID=T2MAV8_HYDVU